MARKIEVEILGDSSSLVGAFRRSSSSASHWNKDISRAARGSIVAAVGFRGLGRSIAFASGAFIGGAGLTAALKASIEGFTAFQDQMQKSVGLANVAQKTVGKFSKQILDLAPAVGRGPQELANAFYFVASSGIAASKAMSIVSASAKAAVAGLGDTATVADAITSAINAYGGANLSAAKAADVLTATVREGKGEAAQFAPVIGNVVALAANLGVSFDQVGAALAAQTRLGTDAETTAIQLQRVFGTLLKVTPKSAAAFHSVGLSAGQLRDMLGEKNGLIKVLTLVKTAFAGNTPALAAAFGDVRALRGILNLVGKQATGTQQVFDRLAHSAGSAKHAFDAIDKDTAQQFRKLKASAQVLGIDLGAIFAPLAVVTAKALTKVAQNFDHFVRKLQNAKGFTAKINVVSTGLQGLGAKLTAEARREFSHIDLGQVGNVVGDKLSDSMDVIRKRIGQVDWSSIGKTIGRSIGVFLRKIDWIGLAVSSIKLARAAFRAAAQLLYSAGLELIKQLLRGVRDEAKIAFLYVEKFGVELVKKLASSTSFAGRFDPFKGIAEKARRRLKEIQDQIDALRGNTVTITIDVQTRSDGGPGAQGRHRDRGQSFAADQKAQAKAQAKANSEAAAAIAAQRAASARATAKAAAEAKRAKNKAIKAFADLMDSFSLQEEQASSTKSLKDDIAVQKRIQSAIFAEMKVEGQTTDLMRQLFESRQKVREDQKQLAQNQADARKKGQFLALGLSATGDKILPSNAALLHKANSLTKALKGTPLDTPKTIRELSKITAVLKGKFGKVGKDVRQAILDMLKDISDALDGKKRTGPLTKTHALNTEEIAKGLGLDPEQIRALRARLSHFNTGGLALAGAPSGGPPNSNFHGDRIVVESHVEVVLDGQKVASAVTRSQQKSARRNPPQKRGPNRHR